jgi:uncharacterized protein (DUF302 family)
MESTMNRLADNPKIAVPGSEAFIRAEAALAVVSDRPFDQVAARLAGSAAANDMAVVQVLDFDRILADKGIVLGMRCRVYELCNARLAARLLALDPGLAHLLPCRVSMHERRGLVTVTAPMPTVLMTEFSHSASVAALARDYEAGLQRVLRGLR